MRFWAVIFILIGCLAQAKDPYAEEAKARESLETFVAKGKASPAQILSTSYGEDFSIYLKNGFTVSFPMSEYPAEVRTYYEHLSPERKQRFLYRRQQVLKGFAQALTFLPVRAFSTGTVLVKDTALFMAKKTEMAFDYMKDNFGIPRSADMISIFKPFSYQAFDLDRENNRPHFSKNYLRRAYAAYEKILRGLDFIILFCAGTKYSILESDRWGVMVGAGPYKAFATGPGGNDFIVPTYVAMGYDWSKKTFFVQPFTDRERTLIGVNIGQSVVGRLGVFAEKSAESTPLLHHGQIASLPLTPTSISRVGSQVTFMAFNGALPGTSGISLGLGLFGYILGADGGTMGVLMLAPTILETISANVSKISRAYIGEARWTPRSHNPWNFTWELFPGWNVIKYSVVDLMNHAAVTTRDYAVKRVARIRGLNQMTKPPKQCGVVLKEYSPSTPSLQASSNNR